MEYKESDDLKQLIIWWDSYLIVFKTVHWCLHQVLNLCRYYFFYLTHKCFVKKENEKCIINWNCQLKLPTTTFYMKLKMTQPIIRLLFLNYINFNKRPSVAEENHNHIILISSNFPADFVSVLSNLSHIFFISRNIHIPVLLEKCIPSALNANFLKIKIDDTSNQINATFITYFCSQLLSPTFSKPK